MNAILIGIIGAIVGSLVTIVVLSTISVGNLRIDQSIREEEPYLFLELRKNLNTIINKKYVVFDVHVANYLTRE